MRLQKGLKSLRSFRRGCARLRNIDLMGGVGGGGVGGGGGFARTRLSAAIDTAIRNCANSSMLTAISDKNRETR